LYPARRKFYPASSVCQPPWRHRQWEERLCCYLSFHDPREVLGIGPRTKIEWLEIHWPQPSDRVETFTDLPIDRYITIVEGSGIR